MKTVYHFFDFWNKVWRTCKVEILSETEKTAKIKLLEFGPNNNPPGTILPKVQKKSLDAYKEIFVAAPQRSWGAYNYM